MACCRDVEDRDESAVDDGGDLLRQLPGLSELWTHTTGDPRICVAVLDGPVDLTHPCLEGANLKHLNSLAPASTQRGRSYLHGTQIASLIFGQAAGPVRGVAPKCRGVIIPVYREREDGAVIPCSQLELARAISLAAAVGANVINISGGQADATGQPEPVLARALELCAREGILVVAAAGNDGCPCLLVPGAAPSVLVVGAMNAQGEPLEFSNWGAAYRTHGILAPGDKLVGATPGGGTALTQGTSGATALVSGVAALLMSGQLRRGQPPLATAVRQALLAGAIDCEEQPSDSCPRLLAGRLNVARSLHLLSQGEPAAMTITPQNAELTPSVHSEPAGGRVVTPGALPASVAPRSEPASASFCPSCRASGEQPLLAYALGQICFDFGNEARRDFFVQRGVAQPQDIEQMVGHLDKVPYDALGLTWTLLQEETPIYAVQPSGPFAAQTHELLRCFLREQLDENVAQVSIPGYVHGRTTLMNGLEVAVIHPDIRGMYSWSTEKLIEEVLGPCPEEPQAKAEHEAEAEEIKNFLERVYYELRNFGVTPQDRALNYAATNLLQVAQVYREAIEEELKLEGITVERSSICRPGSECWDVKVTFFHPTQRHERAKDVYRLTVNVSDVIPVTVGKLRHWSAY